MAYKWSINLSYVVISLHGAVGLTAKQRLSKNWAGEGVRWTIPSNPSDGVLRSAVIWKEKPTPLASPPQMFAASDFSPFGTALFRLAIWGDCKSVIPFWSLFVGSRGDERPSHLIFLCLSWVPRDTHAFNYPSLAWHPPVTGTWLDIWVGCFNVNLKCGAVLRILGMRSNPKDEL